VQPACFAAFCRLATSTSGGGVPSRWSGSNPLVEPLAWLICAPPPPPPPPEEAITATIPATTSRVIRAAKP